MLATQPSQQKDRCLLGKEGSICPQEWPEQVPPEKSSLIHQDVLSWQKKNTKNQQNKQTPKNNYTSFPSLCSAVRVSTRWVLTSLTTHE